LHAWRNKTLRRTLANKRLSTLTISPFEKQIYSSPTRSDDGCQLPARQRRQPGNARNRRQCVRFAAKNRSARRPRNHVVLVVEDDGPHPTARTRTHL
jgi:hypothetical protein